MSRTTDEVFFFTLIDFLVQALFFGLVLYVSNQARMQSGASSVLRRAEQDKHLLYAAGVSNITELTDQLTRLGPISNLAKMARVVDSAGGIQSVRVASRVVASAGGAEKVMGRLAKLQQFEEGSGKPPCVYDVKEGRKVARPVGTVIASDSSIEFVSTTRDFDDLLRPLGQLSESARVMSLRAFAALFAGPVAAHPTCRYSLRFIEKTTFVYARDAARPYFNLAIERR
jgi:hypothetical protein